MRFSNGERLPCRQKKFLFHHKPSRISPLLILGHNPHSSALSARWQVLLLVLFSQTKARLGGRSREFGAGPCQQNHQQRKKLLILPARHHPCSERRGLGSCRGSCCPQLQLFPSAPVLPRGPGAGISVSKQVRKVFFVLSVSHFMGKV